MRVVITGATGNLGTALVRTLSADERVTSIVGVARRRPTWQPTKTTWVQLDLGDDQSGDDALRDVLAGADAVVHLAWRFQPTRDPLSTWRSNVLGAIRVFEATAAAEVPTLVHASSVGAYAPARGRTPVDERWPTHALPTAAYGREKSYLERVLDAFELREQKVRVVRMRPAFVFQRDAAPEQRRLFAGPLLPGWAITAIPVIPDIPGLRFQAVHADDVAAALREAIVRDVHGAFNLAADPILDAEELADLLGARTIRVPGVIAQAGAAALWHARAIPASPGLLRLLRSLPVLDSARAHDQLDWSPEQSSRDAIAAFVHGVRVPRGAATPPLRADAGGRARWREFATGVGARDPS